MSYRQPTIFDTGHVMLDWFSTHQDIIVSPIMQTHLSAPSKLISIKFIYMQCPWGAMHLYCMEPNRQAPLHHLVETHQSAIKDSVFMEMHLIIKWQSRNFINKVI